MTGGRRGGFSLVEICGAIAVLSVGLLALGGVIVSVSHQREQASAKNLVLATAQSLLEEIKSTTNPETIARDYQGAIYGVRGIQSAVTSGEVLRVDVDSTNPKLVWVVVSGRWIVSGKTNTMDLRTQVHSPRGQAQ